MKKRILSLAVVAVMAMQLAACAPNDEKNSETTIKNDETTTVATDDENMNTETADGDITTIKWLEIGDRPKDADSVVAKINEYLGPKIGANIEMQYIGYADYSAKATTKLNSGEEMDIMFTSSWAADYIGNSRNGYYAPLNDYFDTNLKETIEAISPVLVEGSKVDGVLYGVPTNKESGWDNYHEFCEEEVNYLSSKGLDLPSDEILKKRDAFTTEGGVLDYLTKAKAIYNADGIETGTQSGQIGLIITKQDTNPTAYAGLTYDRLDPNSVLGINYMNENDEIHNVYENSDLREFMRTLNQATADGVVSSIAGSIAYDLASARWLYAFYGAYPDAKGVAEAGLGGKKVIIKEWALPYASTSSVTGSLNAICDNSENKDKSADVLNSINTDPVVRNLLAYGIEGTHYNLIDEEGIKKVEVTEQAKNYAPGLFTQGNFFILDIIKGDPAAKWEHFKQRNAENIPSPALGFQFDATSSPDMVANTGNMKAVNDKFNDLMRCDVPVADFDAIYDDYLAALKEAGIEEVKAELQKQYDAWKIEKGNN